MNNTVVTILSQENINLMILLIQEKTTQRKAGSGTILNGTLRNGGVKDKSMTQSHIVLPHATLDLSNGFNGTIMAKSLELSTLV